VENSVDDRPGGSQSGQAGTGRRNTRMPPEARKSELLARAIEFFSEEGFDGGTRALARRIGITQPLIYRYFPSKEDLINEVYNAVYVSQWKDDWTRRLGDRSRSLEARLTAFYRDYSRTIFNRTWMRIFFFAGLKGLDINTRYINRVISNLLVPICMESRANLGLSSDRPVTAEELELVWLMHGAIFYQGIRQHVYGLPGHIDHDRSADTAIKMYLGVAATEVPAAIANSPDLKAALPKGDDA
jgi:AcrR family transcriptional regulator